jgi:hypothetical protein
MKLFRDLYFTLIIILGVIVVVSIIAGVFVVCFCDNCTEIPSGLIAIGSAAVGGLAGLLTNKTLPSIKTPQELIDESDELFMKGVSGIKDESEADKLRELRRKKLERILGKDSNK